MMSEASGVVGVGEGDLEHAVVDEDDIEGNEDEEDGSSAQPPTQVRRTRPLAGAIT